MFSISVCGVNTISQERIREAGKHGFHKAIIPAANKSRQAIKGLDVTAVHNLSQVLDKPK